MFQIKKMITAVSAASLISVSAFATELTTDKEVLSYGAGFQTASQFVNDTSFMEMDLDLLLEGFTAAIEGKDSKVTQEALQQAVQNIQNAQKLEAMEKAEANRKLNADWLTENAKKDGITELPSGVQYEVLASAKEGAAKPVSTDQVLVHYHGSLIDGTVFDSSVDRGEPAQFPVNGVVSGFRESLLNMNVGDKWRVFIPSGMAYGPQASGAIPPSSTLIFELELLEIVKDDAGEK
jgi:FKBP-type peptidyl-prolyl cis-trans isomerase FklB